MTDIQLFAYVILPIGIAAGSWIVALTVNPPRWLRHTLESRHRAPISHPSQNGNFLKTADAQKARRIASGLFICSQPPQVSK